MFATRRTELGKEHIRPIQVDGESFDMNTPPGGANRRCDCDGYRPDTLGSGIGKPSLLFRRYGNPRARSEFLRSLLSNGSPKGHEGNGQSRLSHSKSDLTKPAIAKTWEKLSDS